MATNLHFDVSCPTHEIERHGNAHRQPGDVLEILPQQLLIILLALAPLSLRHQGHTEHSSVNALGKQRGEAFANTEVEGNHLAVLLGDNRFDALANLLHDAVGLLQIAAHGSFR